MPPVAEAVAAELDIDTVFAEVLPTRGGKIENFGEPGAVGMWATA